MRQVQSLACSRIGKRVDRRSPCARRRYVVSPRLLAALLAACVLAAAASCGVGRRYPANNMTELTVKPDLQIELYANTGDDLFVEGTAVQAKALRMSGPFSGSIPGAYGLPFDLSIAQTDLVHQFSTAIHDYYVAEYELTDSRHSLRGKVIVPGDFAGVRVHKKTGQKQWFVDNSRYNRQETVWAGNVNEEDGVEFEETNVVLVNNRSRVKTLRFAGHRSNQVQFEFVDRQGQAVTEDSFTFDLADTGTTTVGVKGYVLEVLGVDNVGIRYRWISFPPTK